MIHLRKITDADIPLLEKWLNSDHVKKWFEIPEENIYLGDWLYEVKNRDGEFSWVTYLIAEADGRSIGFVQYYDCFDAKEEWYVAAVKGGTFSIDYLIGEPFFIGKGYGKEIIRLLIDKVKQNTAAKAIIVQPNKENRASCGVLISNGFVFDEDKKYFELRVN